MASLLSSEANNDPQKGGDAGVFSYTLPQLYSPATEEGKVRLRLQVVEVYQKCGSLRETARILSMSRNAVRKCYGRRYNGS